MKYGIRIHDIKLQNNIENEQIKIQECNCNTCMMTSIKQNKNYSTQQNEIW